MYNPSNPQNFTVLWIHAGPPYLFYNETSDVVEDWEVPRLIFKDKPQVEALNCEPIFETSKARIIVNADNGRVQNYKLLESPKPVADAWSDAFTSHFSNESEYYHDGEYGSFELDYEIDRNTTVR